MILLKCPCCNGQLNYSAEQKAIRCSYCGYKEDYSRDNDKVIETQLQEKLDCAEEFIPEDLGFQILHCNGCGANYTYTKTDINITCAYCGSKQINVESFRHKLVQPVGVIPFQIARAQATQSFSTWLKQGWFHPNKLSSQSKLSELHGLYLPFLTFDAHASGSWTGEAGYHYMESAQVMVNGRMEMRQVQRTRWEYRSGAIQEFLDDTLVLATNHLKEDYERFISGYNLKELVNFDPRLLAGWEAEVYDRELMQSYERAEHSMRNILRHHAASALGGDTQRNLSVQVQFTQQSFKHVYLPLWIASFMYQNKIYRFLINGQTGKVYGNKPLSYFKIGMLVVLFIAFIFGIWYLRQTGIIKL